MSDVYRTSGFQCPSCPSSPLREFGRRLVCDECNGMMIEADDFAASIHELDGGTEPLEIADPQPQTKACPRCTRALTSCTLSIGTLALKGRFLRCDRDGVWVPREAMTAVFARASHRPRANDGKGLAISQWRDTRPRVHTLFVSAYKDRRLGCPVCKETRLHYHGDRWSCSTCSGAFVENAALTAMVEEITAQPWEIPAVTGAGSDRHCPVCAALMTVEVLEAVTIDRCAPHGVWFDDSELQTALHHASSPDRGVGSWIKQLFHRHGTPE
jgi:TFIIB-like protein